MNVDRLISRVCTNKGIDLSDAEFQTVKAHVLGTGALHLGNVLHVIEASLAELIPAFTQEGTLYNKIFRANSADDVKCDACGGATETAILANDREIDYCVKCKIAMPKKPE